MKRLVALGFAFVMVFSLAACGETEVMNKESNEAVDDYILEEETEEEEFNSGNDDEEVFNEAFDTSVTVDETVLWDQDDVKITATGLSYSSWYGLYLDLNIENKSDKTLSFYAGSWYYNWVSVNGYMFDDSYFGEDVNPGETVETDLCFSYSDLDFYGIKEIADIQFAVMIKDEDGNYSYLPSTKVITSAYNSYDYSDTYLELINNGLLGRVTKFDATYVAQDELYSKNGISLVSEVLAYPQDEDYNDGFPILLLEIDNQSEYDIYVTLSDIMVNGVMVEEYTWCTNELYSSAKIIEEIDLGTLFWNEDEALEESNFEDSFDSITFTIGIENENGDEALSPETVTINF